MDFKTFKKLRNSAKVSGSDIARRSDISNSRLSLWESGTVDLKPEQVVSVEEALTAAIWARIAELTKIAKCISEHGEAE